MSTKKDTNMFAFLKRQKHITRTNTPGSVYTMYKIHFKRNTNENKGLESCTSWSPCALWLFWSRRRFQSDPSCILPERRWTTCLKWSAPAKYSAPWKKKKKGVHTCNIHRNTTFWVAWVSDHKIIAAICNSSKTWTNHIFTKTAKKNYKFAMQKICLVYCTHYSGPEISCQLINRWSLKGGGGKQGLRLVSIFNASAIQLISIQNNKLLL